MLRVYDKLEEMIAKRDAEKLAAMKARRWGGLPEDATRVEWELGRGWLKQHGIDTVEDYFRKRGSLVRKLCHDWFRLTDGPVNREQNHQSRARVLPLWRDVQRALGDWAGKPTLPLEPLPSGQVTAIDLGKQMVGCMRRAALLERVELPTLDDACFYGDRLFYRVVLLDPKWLEKYRRELAQQPGFETKEVDDDALE